VAFDIRTFLCFVGEYMSVNNLIPAPGTLPKPLEKVKMGSAEIDGKTYTVVWAKVEKAVILQVWFKNPTSTQKDVDQLFHNVGDSSIEKPISVEKSFIGLDGRFKIFVLDGENEQRVKDLLQKVTDTIELAPVTGDFLESVKKALKVEGEHFKNAFTSKKSGGFGSFQ